MIAIITTGGKQYKVKEGDVLRIEKLPNAEEGTSVSFDQVLCVAQEDGSDMKLGTPMLSGATVKAQVLRTARDKKILVRKFKAKSRYLRTYGHRQPFTEIKIESISA